MITQTLSIESKNGTCPVNHEVFSPRRMPFEVEADQPGLVRGADGVWQVRDYEIAKRILRGKETRQAGFGAEILQKLPDGFIKNDPVLFQDGAEHKKQRREIARFFTPKATSNNYRRMMERYAHEMLAELYEKGRLELSDLTMKMATEVAAQVVGLTSSLLPGMAHRMNHFIEQADFEEVNVKWQPKVLLKHIQNQISMAKFFYLDVKPAIMSRKRKPQEDVISHLIAQNYSSAEIMVECITYGTAGMVTTREFIVVATWHMLENSALRTEYLNANQAARHQILEEILRVDPIVGRLYRRTTEDIELEANGETMTIPAGELVELHIDAINADESVVGAQPLAACPMRKLQKRAQPPIMGFGDGPHRCPGAYIAIQETDIFLHKLLAIKELRLVSEPQVTYRDLVKGYEVRNFIISVENN
ncbi:MAG: cytochrome P450 [Ardenticatenaceae bacterium]